MFYFVEPKEVNEIKQYFGIIHRNLSHDYRVSVKEGDIVYYLDSEQKIISATVTKILSKYHSFGVGYALWVELNNEGNISTFYCFATPEEICERLIDRIKSMEWEAKLVEVPDASITPPQIMNISPICLADQIIGVQPLMDKNSKLFINEE